MALLSFLPKIFTSIFLLIVILMATVTSNRKIGDTACHSPPLREYLERCLWWYFLIIILNGKLMMAIWWVEVMSGTYTEIQFCTLEAPIASLLKNIYTLGQTLQRYQHFFQTYKPLILIPFLHPSLPTSQHFLTSLDSEFHYYNHSLITFLFSNTQLTKS